MHFNLADLFESVVDVVPEREAVICGERRITYRALEQRANQVANFLRSRGIGKGDHVGLYLYNRAEFLEIALGAMKIRAVPININYRYVADELTYMIDNADLKALFFEHELADAVHAAAPHFSTLTTLVALEDSSSSTRAENTLSYEECLENVPDVRDFGERSGDDLYIVYTGGTTGMPKGVMWRHEDVFFAGLQGGNPGGAPIKTPEELPGLVKSKAMAMTFMPLAPFIHGAAQWAALIAFFQGGKVVIIPGRSFRPDLVWDLVAREKVNTLTMVGDAMARPLVDAYQLAQKPPSLMIIASAGAILSDSVKDALKQKLGMVMIMNSFGSSESGHSGHALPGMDKGQDGRVSFKMDDTAAVFDEETFKPLERGSQKLGKYARTGRLPLGYYKDEKKTAETFFTIDGKRWVIPGDYAMVEADGRITLFGRGAVCINSGGEKIFPEEVESALKSHEGVMDCLVVGLPDERWGQRVVAVIEPRKGATFSVAEIDAHAHKHVAGYKCPKEFFLCEKVARQPSGKPDYKWALEHAKSSAPLT